MRNALLKLGTPDQSHLGLAYDVWAPTGADGKVSDEKREDWLAELAKIPVAHGYCQAFDRWEGSFRAPGDVLFEFTLTSRLLIGHGNSSATEVGLTLHHTWGVPIITASALKGVCAHYTASVYGPAKPSSTPWASTDEDPERFRYQGVIWDGTRIKSGPGDIYRVLFGAPGAEEDELWLKQADGLWPAGAAQGGVIFHDALYVPGKETGIAQDVLTVHQKQYYDSAGKAASGKPEPWPNDYESPTPVAFLTVCPKTKFLLALSGPEEKTALAAHILKQALEDWGVGGKTSLGYGRGKIAI